MREEGAREGCTSQADQRSKKGVLLRVLLLVKDHIMLRREAEVGDEGGDERMSCANFRYFLSFHAFFLPSSVQ